MKTLTLLIFSLLAVTVSAEDKATIGVMDISYTVGSSGVEYSYTTDEIMSAPVKMSYLVVIEEDGEFISQVEKPIKEGIFDMVYSLGEVENLSATETFVGLVSNGDILQVYFEAVKKRGGSIDRQSHSSNFAFDDTNTKVLKYADGITLKISRTPIEKT